jgi:hypothetical protein
VWRGETTASISICPARASPRPGCTPPRQYQPCAQTPFRSTRADPCPSSTLGRPQRQGFCEHRPGFCGAPGLGRKEPIPMGWGRAVPAAI